MSDRKTYPARIMLITRIARALAPPDRYDEVINFGAELVQFNNAQLLEIAEALALKYTRFRWTTREVSVG